MHPRIFSLPVSVALAPFAKSTPEGPGVHHSETEGRMVTFRRLAAFNFFMALRIRQARPEIASHASPAMVRMAGLE
jgi:hypothetical protein